MSEVLFRCRVQVPKHGVKKNSKEIRFNRRTKRRYIGSNDNVLLCERWLLQRLQLERLKQKLDEPITADINAKFTFYFPSSVYYTKKGARNKNLADQSNLYELPQDVMIKAGIIDDDNIIVSHDGSRRKPIDGPNYFLEIELTKAVE